MLCQLLWKLPATGLLVALLLQAAMCAGNPVGWLAMYELVMTVPCIAAGACAQSSVEHGAFRETACKGISACVLLSSAVRYVKRLTGYIRYVERQAIITKGVLVQAQAAQCGLSRHGSPQEPAL